MYIFAENKLYEEVKKYIFDNSRLRWDTVLIKLKHWSINSFSLIKYPNNSKIKNNSKSTNELKSVKIINTADN